MRISTLQIFGIADNSIGRANAAIAKTQEQLSTGKRVLTPSDDPVAATKILQLNQNIARVAQFGKNIDIAENNLRLEESTLSSVNNLIQRIQEIAVQAGNTASLTENEYLALSSEVDARLDELFNLVNTRNANGDYIFSGYKSRTPAFTGDALTGFSYQGDDGQMFIQISNNTDLAASDSGKRIFLDIPAAANTVKTQASPANRSDPPVQITLGQVVDQLAYDDFYPEDIVISFNADTALTPPDKNFTVTERSTGKVIEANRPYVSGEDLVYRGVSFRVVGSPVSGTAATAATRAFGADTVVAFPVDFSAINSTFDITVAGRTETLVLDANLTSVADLAANLNSAANGNAAKLANLGMTADAGGLQMPAGINFSISGGDANVDAVTGLATLAGTSAVDGQLATHGDQLFVESADNQGLLTTLARFSDAMRRYDGSQDGADLVSSVVASTLANLASAQTNILEVTSQLGARANTIESTRELHLDTELVSREILSDLQDLDYAEAASRLSAQTLILEAAQASFLRVSQLTLFSRL
ncbi:flagellar hook-associated protein 3 [Exilibacterium tricleocarpae]|uniref:Flagellar hook-associated protein 3 n=1 Tax=Exilibacterium tricleocarpae TaxID=2591008 RepID=A0A545U3U1_9GAMM|nr:flagellar hook-associated protein FlgL [Exilibacterium tricleocarpae]TQV84139.1 flagellar hook-associated protein 3 [Exilibacterium tricleocarpae]